ncbi:hypothetical protein CRYUN_Cryun04dG0037800 [Craigia yunnanensis]
MAMMQWCGAVARRVMMTQRPPLTSASSNGVAAGAPILCGRGDKKTKKGKRFKGSYGNARPKKEKKIERIKDKVEVPRIYKVLAHYWRSDLDFMYTKRKDMNLMHVPGKISHIQIFGKDVISEYCYIYMDIDVIRFTGQRTPAESKVEE